MLREQIINDLQGQLDRFSPNENFVCLFCGFESHDPSETLVHMAERHNFAITNLTSLSLLPNYLQNWRIHPPPIVQAHLYGRNMDTIDPEYPDEKRLRQILHKMRLDNVMNQHEHERTTVNKDLKCLFCHDKFTGTWHQYLQWLFDVHGFNPGRPSNLVFIEELISILRHQIEHNVCIHCFEQLPNQKQLRIHMKKKPHDKIPNDKGYDRYYMVNYLEEGHKWQDIAKEGDEDDQDVPLEEGLKDFDENEINETKCLICECISADPFECLQHMEQFHHFSFEDIKSVIGKDFYKLVRYVNYARDTKNNKICFVCGNAVIGDYADHIDWHDKKIPSNVAEISNNDKYLIPVIEGDPLLTILEDTS